MVHSNKMNQEKNIEENQVLYSYHDLVNVVQELKYEFVKMQEEFKKLKQENTILKSTNTKQIQEEKCESIKKLTPISWLDTNKNKIDLDNWINNIEIKFEYLILLDDNTLYKSLYILLDRIDKIPIYNVNNNYYAFINNNWETIKECDLDNYFQKILSRLWNIFLEWQNINVNKIKVDENFQRTYHSRLQNICNKSCKNKYLFDIKDKIIEKNKI
tara:strand:- start:1670 stop:2314 length:645 start_codon:yes stop_codon:yes gene_type:complete